MSCTEADDSLLLLLLLLLLRSCTCTYITYKQLLDVYYVLDGMIYQAPTILSVLNARLRRCAFMLNRAQSTLSRCVSFDMGQGDMYKLRKAPAALVGGGHGERQEEEEGEGMMDMDDDDNSNSHQQQDRRTRRRMVGRVSRPHPEASAAVERVLATLVEDYPVERRPVTVGGPLGK